MHYKIEAVKRADPIQNNYQSYQKGSEAKRIRKNAFEKLLNCEVGHQVEFTGIERSRICGFVQSKRLLPNKYTVAIVRPGTIGVWRVR